MMAGTQSMALIIQASTAESSRPPQKEPKPLTSISLCSSFLTPPSLLSSVVVTCNLVLSLSLSLWHKKPAPISLCGSFSLPL